MLGNSVFHSAFLPADLCLKRTPEDGKVPIALMRRSRGSMSSRAAASQRCF